MYRRTLIRRTPLLLPWLLAACGGAEPHDFQPLRYTYLEPLRLNVAAIKIEQRFVPSGASPDVSQYDPAPPVQALRNMAQDRLQAFGSSGQAVFIIQDASLTRRGDTISANMAVRLDIYTTGTTRAAYAEARVSRENTGDIDDMPATLYDMTKQMMDAMNVEFEYQVRHSLGTWLLSAGVTATPVQQQPLTQP
jgi:hypothetical protein